MKNTLSFVQQGSTRDKSVVKHLHEQIEKLEASLKKERLEAEASLKKEKLEAEASLTKEKLKADGEKRKLRAEVAESVASSPCASNGALECVAVQAKSAESALNSAQSASADKEAAVKKSTEDAALLKTHLSSHGKSGVEVTLRKRVAELEAEVSKQANNSAAQGIQIERLTKKAKMHEDECRAKGIEIQLASKELEKRRSDRNKLWNKIEAMRHDHNELLVAFDLTADSAQDALQRRTAIRKVSAWILAYTVLK